MLWKKGQQTMSDNQGTARRSPLEALARHQVAALEEVGKAIVSALKSFASTPPAPSTRARRASKRWLISQEEIEEMKDDVEYRIDCLKRGQR